MDLLLEVVIIVGVLVGVALAATSRVEPLREDDPDRVDPRIPPPGVTVTPEAVDRIRFGLALRGYRMDEVDAALDRLRDEVVVLRERLAAAEAMAARPAQPQPLPESPPAEPEPVPPVEAEPQPLRPAPPAVPEPVPPAEAEPRPSAEPMVQASPPASGQQPPEDDDVFAEPPEVAQGPGEPPPVEPPQVEPALLPPPVEEPPAAAHPAPVEEPPAAAHPAPVEEPPAAAHSAPVAEADEAGHREAHEPPR